uniref:Endonuclease/exonuclease/phosphatase domain-containing protein n=1 Tax=Caenorhabditis japonica TaxID=281687 RepID=A0A8R1HVP8_CAEJA
MLKHLIDFFARTTSPTAPTIEIAWKDILKPKPQRIMLQPARRVTIWKTDEPATKSRQKPAEPCLNMMFKFEHDGQEILIKTRRNLEQNLLGEAFPKITHLIRKKVHRDRQDFIDSPFCMQMSPESSKFLTENSKVVDFLEDERIQAVLVNGEEFRIVRDGLPVQGVSLGLRLLVGLYCMPTVTFNTKNTPIKLHWFVKNENVDRNEEQPMKNKKNVDSPVVRIAKEEENGKFSVEGFSFKSQGAYFIPEAQYLDRKVAVLVDTGEDHPVYASISSKPISEAPEEIITDEQVEWCRRNKLEENPNVLRVLTYNIQADLYLNLNLEQSELFFNYCPKAHQSVVYRTPLLLKQISDFIQKSDVSIMFLQEVDVSRHENFLEPFLKTLDFSSVLSKKLHTINEGVAIVFDAKRFRLVDSEGFGLAKLAEEEEENEDVRRILASSELAKERFMSRPTVVQ